MRGPPAELRHTPLLDLLPLFSFGRFQDGITDVLSFEGVAEGGAGRLALRHALQKVRHLVHEAVLVAYLESRYPPFSHIRMVAIGDMDRAPAADASLVRVGEILQPVQVVQVPEN